MSKRPVVFFPLLIIVIFLINGCGISPRNDQADFDRVEAENASILPDYEPDGELTVYYVSEPLYEEAIRLFQHNWPEVILRAESFDNSSEMELRITTELGAGAGPDVMLFSSEFTSVDVLKMAKNGAFMDLTGAFECLSLYDGYLDAGKIGGRQFVIPLGFSIPSIYTSVENMEDQQIELGDSYTFEDLCNEIIKNIYRNEGNAEHTTLQAEQSWNGLPSWLYAAGYNIIDIDSSTITISEEEFKPIADLSLSLRKTEGKTETIVHKYRTDFSNSTSAITFLLFQKSFTIGAAYYNMLFEKRVGEEFTLLTIPDARVQQGINAIVTHYGAVNARSNNSTAAIHFLAEILQFSKRSLTYDDFRKYPLFSSPTNNEKAFIELANSAKLSPEIIEQVDCALSNIIYFQIPNPIVIEIIQSTFDPYLSEEASFDTCFKDMYAKLSLYLCE